MANMTPLGSTRPWVEGQSDIRQSDLNALLDYVKSIQRGPGMTPGMETTVSSSAIQMRSYHIMGNEENKKPLSYLIDGGTITNIEDSETELTGDDQGWFVDNPGDIINPDTSIGPLFLGFTLPMVSRVVYKDDGDEILYGYIRELGFDSTGHLVVVGEEKRYTVDEPEECIVDDDDQGQGQQLMGG